MTKHFSLTTGYVSNTTFNGTQVTQTLLRPPSFQSIICKDSTKKIFHLHFYSKLSCLKPLITLEEYNFSKGDPILTNSQSWNFLANRLSPFPTSPLPTATKKVGFLHLFKPAKEHLIIFDPLSSCLRRVHHVFLYDMSPLDASMNSERGAF